MERGGGLVNGLQNRFGHVDVEAKADDDGDRFFMGDCFGEDAADFFSVDEDVVGPLDLGGDVQGDKDLCAGERHDLAEVGKVGGVFGDCEVDGGVEVGGFGGDPFFFLPASACGLLEGCDAGEMARIELGGVFFGPGIGRGDCFEVYEINFHALRISNFKYSPKHYVGLSVPVSY